MKIIRAKVLGYCMGVKRAVSLLEKTMAAGKNTVYTYGPLIHNDAVVKYFEERGVLTLIDETREFTHELTRTDTSKIQKHDAVVIRAHGIAKDGEEKLRASGADIIDATCTKVKANQKKAESLFNDGYQIFFAGEGDHPETLSIKSYAPDMIIIPQKNFDKFDIKETAKNKFALLAQTTFSADNYSVIAKKLKEILPLVEIFDTICDATGERQKALKEILPLCDAVIIAGGKKSANTKRLYDIAAANEKKTFLVENVSELEKHIPLLQSFDCVGISAGASTPPELIDEIEKALKNAK